MFDFLFVLSVSLFFMLTYGFLALCDRLLEK
jgi:hypothetical protein